MTLSDQGVDLFANAVQADSDEDKTPRLDDDDEEYGSLVDQLNGVDLNEEVLSNAIRKSVLSPPSEGDIDLDDDDIDDT